jgi:biopolymer transport protein TolR
MDVTSGNGETRAVINMTPMIDVLLVLLIIFMAVAPVRSVGLEAVVPQASTDLRQSAENPVVLEISKDGSYRLNSEAIPEASLRDRLIQIYARRGDRVLFVKAAPALEFGSVAAAIDTARGVSIEHVALMPR